MLELLSIPAIVAVVEAIKLAGLPSKYAAILAIIIGVLLGIATGEVMGGIIIGLSASGLYSGVKALVK